MGFFSFITQDTNKSIANKFSDREVFEVIMTDDKGNQWTEDDYEGYGVFGGKDYYALVDEMNGGSGDRDIGIGLYFAKNKKGIKFPSLTESGKYYHDGHPEDCESQGYFYDDSDYINDY